MSVQIVPLDYRSPSHRWAVVSLLESYAATPEGGAMGMSDEAREGVVAMLEASPAAHVLLALRGEEPVGMAVCVESFSTFRARPVMNVHDLVVAPTHRGMGVGRRLLEAVETQARHRGAVAISLEVIGDNHRAMALYRQLGFQGGESIEPAHAAMFWKKSLE